MLIPPSGRPLGSRAFGEQCPWDTALGVHSLPGERPPQAEGGLTLPGSALHEVRLGWTLWGWRRCGNGTHQLCPNCVPPMFAGVAPQLLQLLVLTRPLVSQGRGLLGAREEGPLASGCLSAPCP